MNIIKFLQTRYIDVIDEIEEDSIRGKVIIYVNPMNYFYLRKNKKMLDRLYYRMDGIFFITIVRLFLLKKKKVRRQSFDFTGFADQALSYASYNNLKVFVAGGTENENILFQKKIKSSYPNLLINGHINGYECETKISNYIRAESHDVVILGLGNIKQERVASKLMIGKNTIVFTCGAFISQTATSKHLKYYPKFINKFNLRWLYRFIKEPYTIIRVFKYYSIIPLILIYDALYYYLIEKS